MSTEKLLDASVNIILGAIPATVYCVNLFNLFGLIMSDLADMAAIVSVVILYIKNKDVVNDYFKNLLTFEKKK